MRRQIAGLLAVVAIAAAVPAAQSSASSAPQLQTACVHATILGQSKCIAKGQYCKHSKAANHDYHKYGYHCGKRDSNGRYHLKYWYG